MTLARGVQNSFVLINIGGSRFAVFADCVAEMSPPVRLHSFPHTTDRVSGVIVRRGRIVPVCNATAIVGERRSSANLFYLVAEWGVAGASELLAIPVNGESELISGEMQPRRDSAPRYISGTLSAGSDSIGVLDLSAFAGSPGRNSSAFVPLGTSAITSEVPS
jgi:chemotaxis signal transduction protein